MNNSPSIEYIAGFFDGEGGTSISGTLHKGMRVNILGAERPINHIQWRHFSYITNTDKDILPKIQQMFGGKIQNAGNRISNKCKTCYRLIFIGNDNLRFLNAISPFVHIKKERVEVALEFISTLQEKTQKGIKRKCGKIPYGVQEKRYQLYCEMLRFNSKGNSHIVPRWSLPDPILIPKCLICNRTIKIRNRKRIGHTSLCKICYLSHYAGRYRRSGKLSSNAPSLIAY